MNSREISNTPMRQGIPATKRKRHLNRGGNTPITGGNPSIRGRPPPIRGGQNGGRGGMMRGNTAHKGMVGGYTVPLGPRGMGQFLAFC